MKYVVSCDSIFLKLWYASRNCITLNYIYLEQSISLFIEVKILIVCIADIRQRVRVMKSCVMSGFKMFCLKYLIIYCDYYVKKYL